MNKPRIRKGKLLFRYLLIYLLGFFSSVLLLLLVVSYTSPKRVDFSTNQYQPDISLFTEEIIQNTRKNLVEFIFNSDNVFNLYPSIVSGGTMSVELQNGIVSNITQYSSSENNDTLIIYHTGHDGLTNGETKFIRNLIREGYSVWKIDMPFIGDNEQTIHPDIPKVGHISISNHDQMIYLSEVTDGSPIRYFIEPVITAINEAEKKGFQKIIMIGLSGGGWTTTLAAAIDPRIDASYSVAGTVPMGLRFDHSKNWGDWEQTYPDLYRIASYEDLYIMAAHQRKHVQVLNEFDPCCFDEPRYYLYESAINHVMKEIEGDFEVWWCENEKKHRINPLIGKEIINEINDIGR